MVIPKMQVDALLKDGGRITGIRAGGDEIGARVTVIAEGVLGMLASAAGLREAPAAAAHALGYKEVIELSPGAIEDRWQLNPGEGAAHLFMGSITKGMMGGAFLYTNHDSVSLGMVIGMEQLRRRPDELESWQLLDAFKALPQIRPLLRGGVSGEYSAHAIAEGGIHALPRLAGDGYLLAGDVAGLALNALITVRGMDFAIASGCFAARAIAAASRAGDLASAAPAYEAALRESFMLKDLNTAAAIPAIIENPRLFTHCTGRGYLDTKLSYAATP